MTLLSIATRNVRRNTRRSMLSGTAVAIASMSIVLMFALVVGMEDDVRRNIENWYSGGVRIRHPGFTENETVNPVHLHLTNLSQLVEAVQSVEGVQALSPRIVFPSAIYEDDEQFRGLGLGIDPVLEQRYQDLQPLVTVGRLPAPGATEAVVGTQLAEEIGLDVGDRFTTQTFTALRASNAMTFTVVGLIRFPVGQINANTFLVPLDRAQQLLQMPDGATEILVKADGRGATEALAGRLRASEASGASFLARAGEHGSTEILAMEELDTTWGLMRLSSLIFQFVAVFFFALASTVVITTTMMVIYERIREIGTIGALGMTGRQIVLLFLLEALVISAIGSIAGILLGTGVGLVLQQTGLDFGALLSHFELEFSTVIYPRIRLRSLGVVLLYSVLISGLAALIPARRAAGIRPVEALRTAV